MTSAVVGFVVLLAVVYAGSNRRRAHIAALRAAELSKAVRAMKIELTAREGTEALLSARIDKLEAQNADLEQFAQIASHDLRAPLRAIANLAQWIDEDSGAELSEDSREHLTLLRGRARRLQRLLRDLLTYSRAGRGEIALEPVDLSVLVAEIAEEAATDELDLTVHITKDGGALNIGEKLPNLVTAVAPLRQVLANLISNAVKHNDRPRASVTLEAKACDDWLTLSITDDGPGIDPALFEKALTMFQTLKPASEDSSGMGLALVKRLVESAGGELTLDSPATDDRGLRATVRWPMRWQKRAQA